MKNFSGVFFLMNMNMIVLYENIDQKLPDKFTWTNAL